MPIIFLFLEIVVIFIYVPHINCFLLRNDVGGSIRAGTPIARWLAMENPTKNG
jgi:hypothetical protein